jgi:uncharacterized protein (TIGR00251 family)
MYIKVRVFPGAGREEFTVLGRDSIEIYVKEEAQQGRSNRRVLELLREHFKTGKIKIVSGHHSHSKIVDVSL